MKLRPRPVTAVMVIAALAVALLPLAEVFDGWDWAVRTGGGLVVAGAIAVLLDSRWKPPVPVVAAVAGVGAFVWCAGVVSEAFRRDPVSQDAWSELRDGLFEGWSALMDDQVPLRDPASAKIFVALVAWLAAAGAMHLTARRSTPVATMGVGAVVLGISVAAALPHGAASAVVGAGVGIGALLVVTSITRTADDRWSIGRAISLVMMLGLAGLVAAFAGEAAGGLRDEPFDPRRGRETSVVDISVPDLLADYAVRVNGDESVMTVEPVPAGVALPPLRLRLSTYDVHDGERWLPSTEYRDVATFASPEVVPPGTLVDLDITIEELEDPWIPLLDRLVAIDVDDLRWSESSQTALHRGDLVRYRLTGTVVDRGGLEGLDSAADLVDDRFRELPDALPDSIRAAAKAATADATDAIGQLDALTTLVRELGRDDSRPAGQTLARLRDDLAAGEPTGAVQLASLHALMARSLGHPTRLVVGYTPSDTTVVPSDLHVWTEVAFPGAGWIPLDPVPAADEIIPTITPDLPSTTTSLPDDGVIEARALPRELGPGEDPDQREVAASRDYTWRDVGIFAAALVVLVVGGLAMARHSRRRMRRTEQEAETKVLGAWAELVDRMREAGAPVTPTTTVDDIVFMGAQMDVELGSAAHDLGQLASLALHGPHPPTEAEAERAWEYLRWAEAALVDVRGRRAVLARYLDPRVLRYRTPVAPASRR